MKEYIEREAIQRTVETDMDMQDLYLPSHFLFVIEDIPAADVEKVKHGRWIFGQTMGHSWMKCSECCVSQGGQTATFTYCPNCGAKMDGGSE